MSKRVLVLGTEYFVRMLSELLSDDEMEFVDGVTDRAPHWPHRHLTRFDALYVIGGNLSQSWLVRFARALGKPVVMHWIGSDVLQAAEAMQSGQASPGVTNGCIHWAEVWWIAEELREIGVKAEVVPLASSKTPRAVSPMPDRLTALTYISAARPAFYGSEKIVVLARQFPDVRFRVVSPERTVWAPAGLPSNVETLGFQRDMNAIYESCHVLIRLTDHDGLSFMVLEAAAHGRYVIWTRPLGPLACVTSVEEAAAELGRLRDLHARGALGVNTAAAEWVGRHYAPAHVREIIRRNFAALLQKRGRQDRSLV